MKDKQFAEVYKGDFLAHWTELSQFRKPIVAAVSGYAVRLPVPSNFAPTCAAPADQGFPLAQLAARRRLRARHDVSACASNDLRL